MKRIFVIIIALVAVLSVNAQSTITIKYEVQTGETLYSIARNNNTTVDNILKLNPGLAADRIMAGQKINIPANGQKVPASTSSSIPVVQIEKGFGNESTERKHTPTNASQLVQSQFNNHQSAVTPAVQPTRPKYKTTHEVKKKETIYSVSREYGITEDMLINANPELKKQKLKKGSVINIPYTVEEDKAYYEAVRRAEEEARKPKIVKYNTLNVAVILPFNLSSDKMTVEAQKMANLYQGFLLAVDSLRTRGYSVDITAYEEVGSDAATIESILRKPEMKNMQLIVGPVKSAHLTSVAKFAHENGITHVAPLSNDVNLVSEHPETFQVNIPNTMLYPQVYNKFASVHKDDNIIFVGMNDRNDNVNYIINFKKALDEKGIKYHRVGISEISQIGDMLKKGVNNVVVTSSGSVSAFESLSSKMSQINEKNEYSIQFFGYPEWQTLSSKHEKNLTKFKCQFFTSFYSNNTSLRTLQFNRNFQRWFNQEQYNSFPHYGELGYDIACYFLKGLKEYGSDFKNNIHSITYQSLEFPMNYEKKNNWSGYQNKSLLFVTYSPSGRISVR